MIQPEARDGSPLARNGVEYILKSLRKSAEKDNVNGIVWLARTLEEAMGDPQNLSEAVKWYESLPQKVTLRPHYVSLKCTSMGRASKKTLEKQRSGIAKRLN